MTEYNGEVPYDAAYCTDEGFVVNVDNPDALHCDNCTGYHVIKVTVVPREFAEAAVEWAVATREMGEFETTIDIERNKLRLHLAQASLREQVEQAILR